MIYGLLIFRNYERVVFGSVRNRLGSGRLFSVKLIVNRNLIIVRGSFRLKFYFCLSYYYVILRWLNILLNVI